MMTAGTSASCAGRWRTAMERERRCPRCRISPRMDPQWVCEDCGHRDDLDLDTLLAAADRAERLEAELKLMTDECNVHRVLVGLPPYGGEG